jgi:hypothetical protein
MLSINVFQGASEQYCVKIGVWRAILIQRMGPPDSIIANALPVADFIDSIGHWRTLVRELAMSALPAEADVLG